MKRIALLAAIVLCCSSVASAAPGDPLVSQIGRLSSLQSSLPAQQINNPGTLQAYWVANAQVHMRLAAMHINNWIVIQMLGVPYNPYGLRPSIDVVDKFLTYSEFYLNNATSNPIPPALPPYLAPVYP